MVKQQQLEKQQRKIKKVKKQQNKVKQQQISQPAKVNKVGIYNEEQILEKVKQIQDEFRKRLKLNQGQNPKWSQHLSLISDNSIQINKNTEITEDVQREVQFYNITLENAQLALKYLQEENIPTKRPDDYFAEMFKSDKIMSKIRTKLVLEQQRIQSFEQKKQKQESKKLQRILKAKKEQQKSKEKSNNLEAISQWKQEIKTKGDKAKDLSEFIFNNNKKPHQGVQKKIRKDKDFHKKGGKPQQKGGKPFQKGGKPFQKGGKPFQKGVKPFQKGGKPFQKGGKPQQRGGKPQQRGGDKPFQRNNQKKQFGKNFKQNSNKRGGPSKSFSKGKKGGFNKNRK